MPKTMESNMKGHLLIAYAVVAGLFILAILIGFGIAQVLRAL